jgi:hypothetical protein
MQQCIQGTSPAMALRSLVAHQIRSQFSSQQLERVVCQQSAWAAWLA